MARLLIRYTNASAHSILCKHLKRQIISLDGGFKVIADLNAYHAFATTLRNGSITAQFDALKMLGNIYIIDNPKELAQIVRDASSLSLSPEDAYEHVKARADFKAVSSARAVRGVASLTLLLRNVD